MTRSGNSNKDEHSKSFEKEGFPLIFLVLERKIPSFEFVQDFTDDFFVQYSFRYDSGN